MANIKRGARAYYADTDYRRDGTIEAYSKIDGIPTPTTEDAGKVVKVGSDGYELASDEGAKLVTATVTSDGQGNLSCDKTYAELSASIANGDIVELSYNNQTFVYSGTDYPGIHFALSRNDSYGHNVITAWTISSSNVITFNIEGINTELPTYSSADANKVLTVGNTGALEFANVPTELPAVTSADVGKVLSVDNNSNVIWNDVPGNESIYILYPSAVDNYYDYPSGITGETIYNKFVSGKNIQLRIVHNTLGTVIVRPASYINNAIFFTGLIYDTSASSFKAVRCTVDNLNSETMTRPWFTAV